MKAVVFAASVFASMALAQTQPVPNFELERLTLNPAARASLWASTGDVLLPQDFRVALSGHYEHNPLILRTATERVGNVVSSRVTGHLVGAYGILPWLEVGLQVPVVFFQAGEDLTANGVAKPTSFALGTPWLQARFGLLQENKGDALDLALHLGIGFPFGGPTALTSDKFVSLDPRVGLGKKFGIVRFGAEVGAQLRNGFQNTTLTPDGATVRDEIGSRLDIGLVATTTNKGLRGELGTRIDIPFSRVGVGAEVLGGLRYSFAERFDAHLLAALGFGQLPGIPTFRVLAGVSFGGLNEPNACPADAPATKAGCDFDKDTVLNERDTCVTEPGLVAFDGCPDTDADGLPDQLDTCPKLAGPKERKGCPIIDTDKDGLTDDVDACINEPGPKSRKGCPARDTDKDGLSDDVDSCPTEAGPIANKGCPIKDTDNDGVPDTEDGCITEAGPKDRNGCPLRDTDQDGVTDDVDNCPKEKGTKENQGCLAKQLVVITKDKLIIKEQVFFETAKAKILPKSFPMLNQIAQILKDHPEVRGVRIEGHTDSRGKHDYNVKLSQDRADSVKTYLSEKGVEAGRLLAKGYGPDKPIDTNATDAGRAKNRRVEFVIETAETIKERVIQQ